MIPTTLQSMTRSNIGNVIRTAAAMLLVVLLLPVSALAQKHLWRQATDAELGAVLPARAPVEKEHIETEMRAASGITDGKGHFFAGVVLITAGYSADGKYSHYLITQIPLSMGGVFLAPGQYVFGWQRNGDAQLSVHIHEAITGKLLGNAVAHRMTTTNRVESLRIWPPTEKDANLALLQIGRFAGDCELKDR